MKRLSILVVAALAAPAALAQAYYYEPPLARDELRRCMDIDETLAQRQADLDAEKRVNDREGASIARANASLAEDLRRLDPSNATAVAAHNARAADHNRRVEVHNQRVEEMNRAARAHNNTQANVQSSCGARTFYPRDRDAILWEQGRLR